MVISVLYIDNNQILLDAGKRFLERDEDIRVDTALSLSEALQLLKTSSFDAVIAEYPMRETDGIDLLKIIREKFPKPPSIILTGGDNNDNFNQAMKNGADYYITKSGDPKSRFTALSHIVRRAVKLRESERKITRLNRVYSVLTRVSEATVKFRNRMQLMQEVCKIAVQEGGYTMAWIGFEDPETHRIKGVVASGAVDDFFVNVRMSSEDIMTGQGPTVTALRKGKYIVCNDISADVPMQYWAEHAIKKGYLSAAAFPINTGKTTRGAITFYSQERDFFTDSEIRLLNGLSENVSFALETMELDETCKQVHEELEHSEHRQMEIINYLPEPTFAINAKGAVIIWNTAMEKLTGISPGQILGRGNYEHSFLMMGARIPGLLDLIFASDKELENYHYSVIQRSPKSIRATIQLPNLNGRPATLELTASPLYDQKGQYAGAIESLHAITEIREKDEKFHRLFDTADHGILILKSDTRKVIDANSFIINLTGYSHENMLGRNLGEIGFFKDKPVAEQFFAELEKTGYIMYNDIPMETKDGRIIDVKFVSEMYSFNDEQVIQCSVYDISSRKQFDTARILARKNLNMFSSMTRHDVLNQLMVVSGSLELASFGLQEPELLQHLNRAQTAAKNIQRQISFSREYENLGAATPTWQRISEVIHRAFFEVEAGAITLDMPEDTIDVFADPLFDKVFFHLFNYVYKYGEKVTRIEVSYQYTTTGLILTIADNGIGISPEDKTHLFMQSSGNDKALGLFLAQKILEITGLTIRESGEYKKGTRFEINIPIDGFRTGSPAP
ncbi:MAG: response regulator [Methanoregula sp.]|jgi:PAS domain S-box-containing protein